MRTFVLNAPGDAELIEAPEPEAGPGQVKIRVEACGICGSDLSLFSYMPVPAEYTHPLLGTPGPHALGHEFSGRVVATGDGVDDVPEGALVVVRPNVWDGTCPACLRGEPNLCVKGGFIGVNGGGGGFSDHVVANRDAVHVLPEEVGPDVAAMVESTTVAWHAVKTVGAGEATTALIVGAGPIGLGILGCLKARGAGRVVVSEPSAARRELALQLGADAIDPTAVDVAAHVADATGGAGVDVAFDASGVGQPTYDTTFAALRPGGTSVVVAMFHSPVQVDLNAYLQSEKHLVGSFAYTEEDFQEVIDAIVAGRLDPRPLITSRIPLDDVSEKGIEYLLGEGRNAETKILVVP